MKFLIQLLLALALASPAWGAAYALVTNTFGASSDGFADGTTGSVDTTGADLLVACVSDYSGAATGFTDSKSNTWVPLTPQVGGDAEIQGYYVASPSVGAGHFFTISGSGYYGSIAVAAFSSAHAAPLDQQNGANGTGITSRTTGSVTPTQTDELIVACLSSGAPDTYAISESMTITDQEPNTASAHFGVALAYKVQTTAAAINPNWTWTTSAHAAASIATFKHEAPFTGVSTRRPVAPLVFQ